jgi:hypothetical protein
MADGDFALLMAGSWNPDCGFRHGGQNISLNRRLRRNIMLKNRYIGLPVVAAVLLSTVGCEQLPGNKQQQGAVIGGAGGAVAGAVIGGEKHRVIGALIGGALGATGGYVIGAQADKVKSNDHKGAIDANKRAETQPVTPEQARAATTADINNDGFVTLDEVVAMQKAGLTDRDMISRLEASHQIFELTPEQRRYLLDRGVSRTVVDRLQDINRTERDRLQSSDVISQPSSK